MAVVDVIDLTAPSPSPSIIEITDDDVDQHAFTGSHQVDQERRQRKRRRDGFEQDRARHERLREERDNQRYDGGWQHDRFFDSGEDLHYEGKRRKRDQVTSPAQSPRGRARSLTPPLFTIDTTGCPSVSTPPPEKPVARGIVPRHLMSMTAVQHLAEPLIEHPGEKGLLLPAHVTISGHEYTPVTNEDPPLSPNSEASGIDFLDDDRTVGAPRYFHDNTTYTKPTRTRGPCTNCGDVDHDFRTCPNMICMTCGARNEHGSRSCPILRFCWSCKAKGHLAKDCPHVGELDCGQLNRQDCDRCGSWKHHGTNCPSLWRIYTYLTDAERDTVLADRESKSQLDFVNGGEGYIAHDRWCYNCGGSGHFGDDCHRAAPHDRPNEHSAFGSFNELSGPFASASSAVPASQRPPRPWEEGGQFDDGHGFFAESNVGRKSRENTKAKAREAQRQLEENDDEPDWFSMNRTSSTKEKGKRKPFSRGMSGLPPKPVINIGIRTSSVSQVPVEYDSRREQLPRPSLQDRIDVGDMLPKERLHGDRDHGENRREEVRREEVELRRRDNDRRDRDRGEKRRRDVSRDNRRDYDRRDRRNYPSYDEPHREGGSRWRGGYDR